MRNVLFRFALLCFAVASGWAQAPPNDPLPRSDTPATAKNPPSSKDRLPTRDSQRSEESSSKDNPVDLAPPADDINHPGTDEEDAITELKAWDPHRAAKDVEVGLYYLKEKNYRGALNRFRDALEFKPRDAEATYYLALTLEKSDNLVEAAQRYQEYLEILPKGPLAADARKGLERTKAASAKAAQTTENKEQKKD